MVAVGGGHGLARALNALRILGVEPVALVTVADDGGSSGRLRRDLGIIAPGDLRKALVTLARNHALADALEHRFQRGQLEGHPLGNLLLVALAEQTEGDFVDALDRAAGLLDSAGRVLPSTTEPVQLKARVSGEEVDGQVKVANAGGRVERVWLEPEHPPACADAVAAIEQAGLVVLGPGSLFTSVIATLLVPDLAAALVRTEAAVVYVANLLTEPGETGGLDIGAHVRALLAHVPGLRLDAAVLHDGPRAPGSGEPIGTELDPSLVGEVVPADLAYRHRQSGHDPARLAAALSPLLRRAAGGSSR
ncbi:MAG: uridine diphosphate-N-acetylglucosamine-binding protein YvcK [Actinomycetota bacterium]|nr:uridine diphosphate-N-acetylglucosamine-binding protein YvcK [Actinomycetota bacterium]